MKLLFLLLLTVSKADTLLVVFCAVVITFVDAHAAGCWCRSGGWIWMEWSGNKAILSVRHSAFASTAAVFALMVLLPATVASAAAAIGTCIVFSFCRPSPLVVHSEVSAAPSSSAAWVVRRAISSSAAALPWTRVKPRGSTRMTANTAWAPQQHPSRRCWTACEEAP